MRRGVSGMRPAFATSLLATAWLLAVGAGSLEAQVGAVSGTVTEQRTGVPVSIAVVEVEGTRISAVTDQQGRYRLENVPAGSRVLVIRRLGYGQVRQDVEVASAGETVVNLVLESTAIRLDQVVVTGTAGGAQRRAIGSSVAVIDAAATMQLARAPDFTTLLNARAPGVVLNRGSGRVGASSSIQIRGRSSLGLGNSPIIYIDGVRVNSETGQGAFGGVTLGTQGADVRGRLNDIHPEDIESIEVIKGPAAAAMYGTDASNGVIQVITKRGLVGQTPQINLRVQYGTMSFRNAENRLPTNLVRDGSGEIVEWNAVRAERERGEELFRRGSSTEVHASVSGGTDRFRYYASAGVRDEEGIEPNNYGGQYSFHSNVDVEMTPRVTFATSLNYTRIESHLGTETGASAMLGATCGHNLLFPTARGFCLNLPPELSWELYDNSDATSRFTGSGTFTFRLADWFNHRLVFGMDDVASDARALERYATEELRPFLSPTQAAGRIGQTLRDRRAFTLDYAANATRDLTSLLNSVTSVGLQFDRINSRTSGLGGLGFPAPGVELISATATRQDATQSELTNTTLGAYAQQRFAWDDRFFLTGALRIDNNSAFGEDLKWVVYPKLDASWMVSEESFWPLVDQVNTFRIRAAYGESGSAPNAFSALRTFSPVQGPGNTNAVTAGSLGNPSLRPERGKELEFGFEAVVFDRLSLDFTYFTKKTTDLIVNQAVAPSTGFSGSVPRNLGRVDNSGFEASANLRALSYGIVSWQVEASLSKNRDEIIDLGEVSGAVSSAGAASRVGYTIGGFWARRVVSAELNQNGQAINVLCDGGAGAAPIACPQAPFVYLGPSAPTTTGSVGNIVNIGSRLRLYALVDFASGHRRLNTDEQLRCSGLLGVGLCEVNIYPERFSPIQVAQSVGTAVGQGMVSYYYQDASFVKLREVSASYDLPRTWIPGTSRASLTLSARELATWTDFAGLDPENTGQAVVPPLTRLTASLNIGF